MSLLEAALRELTWLVTHDSTNPPRRPAAMMMQLEQVLSARGLQVSRDDHGDGCISVTARRGEARTLLTAHLDTVPVAPGWTRDPFTLTLEEGRAYALGATDVKGGAAAMMAAAFATDAPCTILFTTDEEAGNARCMRSFVDTKPELDFAVVAEPTRVQAVLAHRGIAAGVLDFQGRAAHSSLSGQHSALHDLVRWGTAALSLAETLEREPAGPSGLSGVRFNLGKVDGGEKSNVVAGRATARFGLRPPPELSPREAMRRFAELAPEAAFSEAFSGPPLPHTPELGQVARAHAERYGFPLAEPVAFWTEASVLSAAGIPAVVLGPGDIGLAHGADEYVELAELEAAARLYLAMLEAS